MQKGKENTLGDAIKAVQVGSGMSQTEFAAKIGVSSMSLWRWTQGKSKPHHSFLKKIKAMEKKIDGDNDE